MIREHDRRLWDDHDRSQLVLVINMTMAQAQTAGQAMLQRVSLRCTKSDQ